MSIFNRKIKAKQSENVEEYIETLWKLREISNSPARTSEIAHILGVAPPSVVDMLKKLEREKYVIYKTRKGVKLSKKGERLGRQVMRNHRLAEVLMRKTLKIVVDEVTACGVEHHMSEQFANALCTMLKHPKTCPHGKKIPPGECCEKSIS